MRTTGPILAIGGITLGNEVLLNGQPVDLRIPVATAIAAGAFALAEHIYEPLAVGLAWVALITVLFVRTKTNVPAPVESLNTWLQKAGGGK